MKKTLEKFYKDYTNSLNAITKNPDFKILNKAFNLIENAIINKFLNINEIQTDEIVRQTFNLIINFIENKIYSKRTDMKWNEENKIYEYL